MDSAINQMDKYDHRRHGSDWLAELELQFQLGEVDIDQSKINWCQLLIGATGSYILAGLEDEASWETAKEMLLSRLGLGSMKDKAWAALKNYKKRPQMKLWSSLSRLKNSPDGYTLMMRKPLNGRLWTLS